MTTGLNLGQDGGILRYFPEIDDRRHRVRSQATNCRMRQNCAYLLAASRNCGRSRFAMVLAVTNCLSGWAALNHAASAAASRLIGCINDGICALRLRHQCEDSAAAMACRSTNTSSLVLNFASWLSFPFARSKKRPFTHSTAFGWETAARRRAAIRSIIVAAEPGSAISASHRASAAPSR